MSTIVFRLSPGIILLALAGGTSAVAASRPNIVLCMADDQGWGDMAYNGHPQLKTPVFDEMARTGLRLNRFYAAAPVCSPTRASVLTGRTPHRSGVFSWGHSLRPEEITIAELLHEAGYATGHFGKWHLGSVLAEAPTSPGAQGFDRWLSAPNFFEVNPWLSAEGRARQFTGESSEVIVDAALEFARTQHQAERPFLAVIWFGSPHSPHVGTAADRKLYADLPPKQQHFLAEITAMDRAMGKLRRELRTLGVADQTLLWYCSDNGAIPEGSTGGLRGKKGTLYEGGIRVPCLIEWPAQLRGPREIEVSASTVDILPTVLEAVGIKSGQGRPLDGESLMPMLAGTTKERTGPLGFWDAHVKGLSTPSDAILASVAAKQAAKEEITQPAALGFPPAPLQWKDGDDEFAGHSAWIDGDWKLHRVQGPRGAVKHELYHLGRDPQEKHDVSGDEPQRTAELRGALEEWLKSVTGSLRGADY